MKKANKKSYISIIVSTIMLILLSVLLLNKGIIYTGNIGTDHIENISVVQKFDKSMTSNIEGEPIDLKEQEILYESVKDKINIQKEDAKEIFKEKIISLFGDSISIADSEIWLMNVGGLENANYKWWLVVENKQDKKLYWCIQNAMTSSCEKIEKYDYAGLNNANDGAIITRKAVELKANQLESYIKKAEEIIVRNNFLNSENNNIGEISLKDKLYIGIRPIVVLNTEIKNGEITKITFYSDTDELVGIDIIKNIN